MGWVATVAPIAMSLLSSMQSSQGQRSEGAAQAQAFRNNAAVALKEREFIQGSADVQKAQISRAKGQLMGRQKALYAKGGVVPTSGSPFEVMVDSAAQSEMDKSITQYNADIEKRRDEMMAAQYNLAASNSISGSNTNANATLLQGVGSTMGSWGSAYSGGKTTPTTSPSGKQFKGMK